MLYWLIGEFEKWGTFRLLRSHSVLLGLGALLTAFLVWWFLPRLWNRLPQDRGKVLKKSDGTIESTPDAKKSKGKPTGAGFMMALFTLPAILLFFPANSWAFLWDYAVIACIYISMLFGYADDKSDLPWSRLKKGLLDYAIACAAAFCLAEGQDVITWWPFTTETLLVPIAIYVPLAGALLWLAINTTNCSDGVDGLAGSLVLISLMFLVFFLYAVVGHKEISAYLLLPTSGAAAKWAIFGAMVTGSLAGYLWYNAYPSQVLMGDAGSRMLGMVVGVLVLVAGNPLLLLVVAPVVLINGGGGLVKIVLLKGLKKLGINVAAAQDPATTESSPFRPLVKVLHRYRFPLHDHCRKNLAWEPAQVMVRFVLLQTLLIPLLFILLVKIR